MRLSPDGALSLLACALLLFVMVSAESNEQFHHPVIHVGVATPWESYYSPPRVPYYDGPSALAPMRTETADPLASLDLVPAHAFHRSRLATAILREAPSPCTDCALINPKIDSIAPDDFGFSELQKEQEELHRDNMIVMQQKQSIQSAELEVRKFQAKLESDKQTLADNQVNLKKWTDEMIAHVNAYKDALMEAQQGIGTGGSQDESSSTVPLPPSYTSTGSPQFRALRDDDVSGNAEASSPTSASSSDSSQFGSLHDFKITSEELHRHLPSSLTSLRIKHLSKPTAKPF